MGEACGCRSICDHRLSPMELWAGVLEQEGEVSGYLGNKKNKEKVYILLTWFKLNSSFSFVMFVFE